MKKKETKLSMSTLLHFRYTAHRKTHREKAPRTNNPGKANERLGTRGELIRKRLETTYAKPMDDAVDGDFVCGNAQLQNNLNSEKIATSSFHDTLSC